MRNIFQYVNSPINIILLINKTKFLLVCIFIGLSTYETAAQFNDFNQLSNKHYNEIAFLTTHNAFNNAQENFTLPNQDFSIIRQLVDGVRALMIDVYDVDGVSTVYHGKSFLGSKPLSYFLSQINDFLTNNPNEVVTIIFECYTTANKIEDALSDAGLLTMTYTKTGTSWPTLQEMIDSGKRLVIFSDKNDTSATQKWYHYVWKYAVETSFSVTDRDDFTSDFNRGKAGYDLFILNHFVVSSLLGTGKRDQALVVNSYLFLLDRISKCQTEKDKFPNFITLDFYNLGDGLSVVNRLNNVVDTTNQKVYSNEVSKIYPNPTNSLLNVEILLNYTAPFDYSLLTVDGRYITKSTHNWNRNFQIVCNQLPKGIYFVHVRDVKQKVFMAKALIN